MKSKSYRFWIWVSIPWAIACVIWCVGLYSSNQKAVDIAKQAVLIEKQAKLLEEQRVLLEGQQVLVQRQQVIMDSRGSWMLALKAHSTEVGKDRATRGNVQDGFDELRELLEQVGIVLRKGVILKKYEPESKFPEVPRW